MGTEAWGVAPGWYEKPFQGKWSHLVFLTPTLIASIYGMNFHHMPELAYSWGYPVVLMAMAASAVIPYLLLKWKRWL